jgi:hypothetical protein
MVHDGDDQAHLPDDADDRMWRRQYLGYRTRQIRSRLRAAECQVETHNGHECLALWSDAAPVVTPDWWGGQQMYGPPLAA